MMKKSEIHLSGTEKISKFVSRFGRKITKFSQQWENYKIQSAVEKYRKILLIKGETKYTSSKYFFLNKVQECPFLEIPTQQPFLSRVNTI